jgi:hypothetical protein
MREWDSPLADSERDAILNRIADGIVRRKMETPAILFLEMHKPLSFVASQGLIVTSPFVAPFVGLENVQIVSQLLADRNNVELLVRHIEELAQARQQPRPHASEGG